MAASLNKFQGIGRLGKNPEVRSLDNGTTVANFSLAISESYKDKTTGEKKENTEWVPVVAWKGLADIASKYLHKGDLVYIEGKLRTRSWEKDGERKYITEIVLDSLQMLSSKGGDTERNAESETPHTGSHTNSGPGSASPQAGRGPLHTGGSDDLPF